MPYQPSERFVGDVADAFAECNCLRIENESLRAHATHERSLGAEGPMIELQSARQCIARLEEALREISYRYADQDMSHVDFRVRAKQIADEALQP